MTIFVSLSANTDLSYPPAPATGHYVGVPAPGPKGLSPRPVTGPKHVACAGAWQQTHSYLLFIYLQFFLWELYRHFSPGPTGTFIQIRNKKTQ